MKLNDFHKINIARQHEAFAPPHPLMALIVCVQEEVGELAGAVLGVTGEKKRKAHKTREDVLDAVADAMTYLSLVAGSVECDDLEGLLADTFDMVSDRVGSKYKVNHTSLEDASRKLLAIVQANCDWESVATQHPNRDSGDQAWKWVEAIAAVEKALG